MLAVWVNGIRAAEIGTGDSGGFNLCYTNDWLAYPYCYPFSPHLPLGVISSGADVSNFFANLLPEGTALEVAASMHNLSRHDAFGLLARIGREAAGALIIAPEGEAIAVDADLRPLSREELSHRIDARPLIPFAAWDGKIRLSIAGYQDKLAVYLDEADQMYLPGGSASSTHIIKPDNSNPAFPFMPANEYFCMRLATACKLQTPSVVLQHIPQALYMVERFDRKKTLSGPAASVTRLHQIDLCQVLNLSVDMKYQQAYEFSAQGANYSDLFAAAASTIQPLKTKMALMRAIVFNYLIGNTDAHAKNFSFFLDHAGLRLAPFYDLVSGTIYGLKEMALFIGREENIDLISALDWMELSKNTALHPALLATELRTQAKTWRQVAPTLLDDPAYRPDEKHFLQGMLTEMQARVQLMEQQAQMLKELTRA
jgi:serine/threonine-protein kinase HipA